MFIQKQINKQILVPKKSRKQYLDEIIQNLNEKGKFSISILLDDRGMILSEYNTTVSLEKDAIAAMFSLIHNVVDRTVQNLNLESKELISIGTKQGDFYTCDFPLKNYNRKMILVALSAHLPLNKTPFQENDSKVRKFDPPKEFPDLKVSYWRLFKVFITRKLRILPDLENISRNLFRKKNSNDLFYKSENEEIPEEINKSILFQETVKEIQAIFNQ